MSVSDDLLRRLVRQMSRNEGIDRGQAPGHSHQIPGIWDDDNGEIAGMRCAWCELWNEAKRVAAL